MKFKIASILFIVFLSSLIFFLNWRLPSRFSFHDSARDIADINYTTKLNCNEDLSSFNYCRFHIDSESRVLTIVIGDSLGLALSEYLASISINHIYLGAGSCPMLLGMVMTYSNENCAEQLQYFYEQELEHLRENYDFVGFILVHSAVYISTIGERDYRNSLQDSILKIRSAYQGQTSPLAVLDPALRPVEELTTCLPRRLFSQVACLTNYRPEQVAQMRIFEELNLDRLTSTEIELSPKLVEYKDDLHLSMLGVERIYSDSLNAWLTSSALSTIGSDNSKVD